MFQKFNYTKFILFSLLILISSLTYAQDSLTTTRLLTIEDGLSHNITSVTHQDKFGFIWIGTDEGLNRFDGHEFRWFTKEENGLEANMIDDIVSDKWDKLWLLEGGGRQDLKQVSLIDTKSFEVTQLKVRFSENEAFLEEKVISVINSEEEEIIIYTKSGKIYFLATENKLQVLPISDQFKPFSFNKKKEIWGELDHAIVKINLKGKVLESIPIDKGWKLESLEEDNEGNPWWFEVQYKSSKRSRKAGIRLRCKVKNTVNELSTSPFNNNSFNLTIKNQKGKLIIHNRLLFCVYNPKTFQVRRANSIQ